LPKPVKLKIWSQISSCAYTPDFTDL